MAEAYIVDAVRTPVGRRGGGLAGAHPADLGAHVISALLAADRTRPARRRRRRLRLRRHHRPAGRRHRPDRVAGRRAARGGARRHGGPPVRLVAAGRALRRAGRDERDRGRGGRGRRAEHEPDPDRGGDAGRPAVRLRRSVLRLGRAGWRATAIRRSRSSAAADMIAAKWGDQPRRDGAYALASHQRAASQRSTTGASPPRSRRTARCRSTSALAGTPRWRRWPALKPLRTDGLITAALSSQIADAAAARAGRLRARAVPSTA